MIKKCSQEKYRCIPRLQQQGPNTENCLNEAAVLIPTLYIALKNLTPVSSMWPIGPLVVITVTLYERVYVLNSEWPELGYIFF